MEITRESGKGIECECERVGLRNKNTFNENNARRVEEEG